MVGKGEEGVSSGGGGRNWKKAMDERREGKNIAEGRGWRGREGVKERKKRRKHKGEGKEIIVLEQYNTRLPDSVREHTRKLPVVIRTHTRFLCRPWLSVLSLAIEQHICLSSC